jgi:ribosomal protein L11 methylase PrmA
VRGTRPAGWWVLALEAPPRGREIELADALRRLGARSLERQGDQVVARFPAMERAEPGALLARIAAVSAAPVQAVRWQSYEEWRRERFGEAGGPRHVGRRFVVVPAAGPAAEIRAPGALPLRGPRPDRRLSAEVGRDAVVIRIVPGLAFGAADHPTTAACLTLLEDRAVAGARVLDVGAGSGVLAIASALLGATRVVAVEADPLAAGEAHENVLRNGVGERVEVFVRPVLRGYVPPGGPFDGVVANLEGAHLMPLLPTLGSLLRPGGWLVLAGLVVDERPPALSTLAEAGVDRLLDERADGAWWSAALERAPTPPSP